MILELIDLISFLLLAKERNNPQLARTYPPPSMCIFHLPLLWKLFLIPFLTPNLNFKFIEK